MAERRHPQIVNLAEVEPRTEVRGKFGFLGRRLGPLVGAKALGCSHFKIPPGQQAFPQHFHTANEEAVYVLAGEGTVRIGEKSVAIRAGDYIAFPVGPEFAHSIQNISAGPLQLLSISTMQPVEVVGYPDSKKTAAVAINTAAQPPAPWIRLIVKDQPNADYYEGEL